METNVHMEVYILNTSVHSAASSANYQRLDINIFHPDRKALSWDTYVQF